MMIEPEEQTPCQCDEDCACGNMADLISGSGAAICGCCLADCPDVHGPGGRTWRKGYMVRLVPSGSGCELHVDGVGVTHCAEGADAEGAARDFLESLGRDDARTASVMLWVAPRQ